MKLHSKWGWIKSQGVNRLPQWHQLRDIFQQVCWFRQICLFMTTLHMKEPHFYKLRIHFLMKNQYSQGKLTCLLSQLCKLNLQKWILQGRLPQEKTGQTVHFSIASFVRTQQFYSNKDWSTVVTSAKWEFKCKRHQPPSRKWHNEKCKCLHKT